MTDHARTDPEMPCRDLVEVVTLYLDGGLDDTDRRRFEQHLAECEDCDAYVEQIRATIAGTERSGARGAPLPAALREDVRRAFRGWVP